MQALEETLRNKREIENRFNYNIIADIISQNTFSTDELKDIFLNFPIEDAQDDAKLLAEAKQNLSINDGSSIVT
jgi:adenine specific DNA methylase Mod